MHQTKLDGIYIKKINSFFEDELEKNILFIFIPIILIVIYLFAIYFIYLPNNPFTVKTARKYLRMRRFSVVERSENPYQFQCTELVFSDKEKGNPRLDQSPPFHVQCGRKRGY